MLLDASVLAGVAILAFATGSVGAQRTTLSMTRSRAPLTRTAATSTKTSAAPTSTATGNWFKPKPGTTFLWSLDEAIPSNPKSNTGLKLSADVYGLDLFGTSKEQIKAYHDAGKKIVCYMSAGSWESGRPDSSKFTPACYCNKSSKCKMDGWPEYWLDLHTPSCVSNIEGIMAARIQLGKDKGCDAIEADNEDSFANKSGWQTTIDDQLNYLLFLSKTAHDLGLGIGLKNAPSLIKQRPIIVNETDFSLIEECQAYNECSSYQAFIDADKAAWDNEYERKITCKKGTGMQVTSYTSYDVNYKNIDAVCLA